MKFIAWLTLFTLCFNLPAFSQEEEEEKKVIPETYNLGEDDNPFVAGMIFGGNTGTMSSDNYGGFHNVSYSAGVTVYARLAKKLWFGPEILYVKRGVTGVRMTVSPYWGEYFEKYYLKMSSAELPLLFHFFNSKKPWYHVDFGVSYWRYINSKETLMTSPITIYPDQNLYYFNKNNFDIVIGGAIHLNPKLYLNIRWQRSLTTVRNWQQVHPYVGAGNQSMTQCSLQLMYLFRKNQQ